MRAGAEGSECVLDYYQSNLDLRGVILAVGKASVQMDGVVCATNLYIEAANCGRRCNPEERVTMHVFAGGNRIARGEPTGPLGSFGGLLDGPIGLAIWTMLYLRIPIEIGPNYKVFAESWEYGEFGFMAIGGKYVIETLGDFMGQPILRVISNFLSVLSIGFGFPYWAYTCWTIYEYYVEHGEFPYYFDGSDEPIYFKLALFSAPILEQFFDPASFTPVNTMILALVIGYWIYWKYDNGVIRDSWLTYYWSFAAAIWLYALDSMY